MHRLVLVARILLGLIFTIFGLNFFFKFIALPEFNDAASSFYAALVASGVMHVVKGVEVVGGVMLLVGVWVPLALVILFPIVLNILLFHLLLDATTLPVSILVMALELFLAWSYRDSFKGLLRRNAPLS